MVRLFGVQIAHGFSSEARVFAGLLEHRNSRYQALVLHHDWPGDRTSAERFASTASVPLLRMDTGWRPNRDGRRPLLDKVYSRLRFRLMLPKMLAAARRYDPDVVYSNQQAWDCTAATYIARRLRRPQIIHLHYTIGPWLRRPTLRALPRADRVVCISEYIRQMALAYGIAPDRAVTVRNTLKLMPPPEPDTRRQVRAEFKIPADATVAGIVGRLDEGKGHADTIAAFARVAPTHPQFYLLIVGDGRIRRQLHELAQRTPCANRILFTGWRDDVSRLLAGMDVFIHPSRNEPFGLALLEASAMGLPCLAYAEGGPCEILVHGETGYLASPGDIGQLARYLACCVEDPDRARALGSAGSERVAEEFQPDRAGTALAQIVRDVCYSPR